MSLNHKRRIFRPEPGSRPSPAVMLAAAAGAVTLVLAASLFVRSSEAPARAPSSSHVSAVPNQVVVIDADTLRVADQVVRLAGITAPRRGSLCHDTGSAAIDCGVAAANALASLLRSGGMIAPSAATTARAGPWRTASQAPSA